MVAALACNAIRHVTSRFPYAVSYMVMVFWFLQEIVLPSTDFLCSLTEAVNLPEVEVNIRYGFMFKIRRYVSTIL